MANVKITDLAAYTNPDSTDVLPIVDVGTDVTKKVSIADLLENAGSGTASAPGIAFDGDNNTGIYHPGADQVAISTNGSEAVRIDGGGRLLVGTSSSSTPDTLVLQGNTDDSATGSAQLRLKRNTTLVSDTNIGNISWGKGLNTGAKIGAFADAVWTDGSSHAARLEFSTTADGAASPTERMIITNDGYVNWTSTGVSIPTNNVSGTSVHGSDGSLLGSRGNGGKYFTFYNFSDSAEIGSIVNSGGTSTSYNTSSDYRLKENIVPLTGAIDRLNQLQVHRFNFITNPDTTVDGFIAHEVQAVVPECVTGTKDEVDENGDPVYQGIDQSKLVPLLAAALQELSAQNKTLEARLSALEGQ